MNEPVRQRQPRLRDDAYLAWLRKQPCSCGCGKPAPSDAAHIRSGSIAMGKPYTGKAEKPSDFWAVPLNRSCHMRQTDHGDELGWWRAHGHDPFQLAISYYREFQSTRPEPTTPKPRRSRMAKPTKPRKPPGKRQKIKSRGFDRRHRPLPGKHHFGG